MLLAPRGTTLHEAHISLALMQHVNLLQHPQLQGGDKIKQFGDSFQNSSLSTSDSKLTKRFAANRYKLQQQRFVQAQKTS